jgi:hypothetical protein
MTHKCEHCHCLNLEGQNPEQHFTDCPLYDPRFDKRGK